MPHPAPLARDAVIFVPGLGTESVDQSIDGIASRVRMAIDTNAATAEATFRSEISEEEYGEGRRTRISTIYRKDGDEESAVLDLYEFKYLERLTEKEEGRPLLMKAVSVLLAVLGQIPAFVRLFDFCNGAKSKKERFQLMAAGAFMALLLVYLGLLGYALWETIQLALNPGEVPTFAPARWTGSLLRVLHLGGVAAWVERFVNGRTIVVALAIVGALLPEKTAVRETINRVAMEFLSSIHYLSHGARSRVLQGQFESLVEHITEKGGKTNYRAIHVMAYSFGTIVALDALYPATNPAAARLRRIDTLVTIGSPYDFIRAFWPDYFVRRRPMDGAPRRWINVYDPCDVFGSNFRDDENDEEPVSSLGAAEPLPAVPPPLKPRNVRYLSGPHSERRGFWDTVALMGLKSHSLYWETPGEQEKCAFSNLLPVLYDGDALLK